MSKLEQEPWAIRSVLFVPGHLERFVPKAAESGADCVVLDLQDGVPPDRKAEARVTVRRVLESGLLAHKRAMVRLNPAYTGLTQLDLDAVACAPLDGFMFPMITVPVEIMALDIMVNLKEKTLGLDEGHFAVIVVIETPLGVINAYQIAKASKRVAALLFGSEDYMVEMQDRHDDEQSALHVPRAQIAMAARAAGIEPIDTPYVHVHDLAGLEAHATRGRILGMSGMALLSPRQIPIAHAVYTPSEEEIQDARHVVCISEEARKAGRSYAIIDGRLVAPSREKQARSVLARAAAITKLESMSSKAQEENQEKGAQS